ncbi:Rieske (2Fe-2S) protein [Mangrovicoccus algicola]|uniref:Rieske (2Fe-2S) protein n=1 Tax=Mangrovicoccus algicola TaxID=2771008 RepID=A0A8J7CX15_9RHOB|nr:Rieske (2Fe-2S) protein [Mangrovicoccus algicola]MBE3640049.1 Rieske (2Fe-2S) protein [Mangrovicoccus algicola]
MTPCPVALSRDLPPGGVKRVFARGRELALWRGASGQVAAWDNRCPHRGMRLSHGFVRGDRLACLYHGWQYGTDGTCAHIPAHPELCPPATIRATGCDAAEAGGVIWVAPEGYAAPPELPRGLVALRSLTFRCDAARLARICGLEAAPVLYLPDHPSLVILPNPLPGGQVEAHVLTAPLPAADRVAAVHLTEALRRAAEAEETA